MGYTIQIVTYKKRFNCQNITISKYNYRVNKTHSNTTRMCVHIPCQTFYLLNMSSFFFLSHFDEDQHNQIQIVNIMGTSNETCIQTRLLHDIIVSVFEMWSMFNGLESNYFLFKGSYKKSAIEFLLSSIWLWPMHKRGAYTFFSTFIPCVCKHMKCKCLLLTIQHLVCMCVCVCISFCVRIYLNIKPVNMTVAAALNER